MFLEYKKIKSSQGGCSFLEFHAKKLKLKRKQRIACGGRAFFGAYFGTASGMSKKHYNKRMKQVTV
jgi:hypothetical protein